MFSDRARLSDDVRSAADFTLALKALAGFEEQYAVVNLQGINVGLLV